MENKYYAKYSNLPVIRPETIPSNNLVRSATSSWSSQCCCDPYDLSSVNDEYSTPEYVAEITSTQNDYSAKLLTAAKLILKVLSESQKNWVHKNLNDNDEQSDLMRIAVDFQSPLSRISGINMINFPRSMPTTG
jgi:hypothetical protein